MSSDKTSQETYTVEHPFVRAEYQFWEMDSEGAASVKRPTWKPGVKAEDITGHGDVDYFCDGIGKQVLSVVSRHKPGKYPERVFYLRAWIDPDGKRFGKSALRIATKEKFDRICRGYRYEYALRNQKAIGVGA